MGCKGLGVGIKQTVAGRSQLMNPAMWMILVTVVICITVQVITLYRVAQENWHRFLYALTLPNINRFSKLFHSQNQEKICNNTVLSL